MKTSKLLPLAALATMLAGAGAMVATAQTMNGTAGGEGPGSVQADWGRDGDGHRHGRSGQGRGGPLMGGLFPQVFAQIDTDGDNAVTQAEIDTWRAAEMAGADTSGDGRISLAEFTPAWTTFMQARIVDDFQRLDDDGDGQITTAEVDARLGAVVALMDRDGDGTLSPADHRARGFRD